MKDRVKLFLINATLSAICFFIDHAMLSTAHNRQRCNRCGHKEKRGPETNYKWVADVEEEVRDVKNFNPCK